MFADCDGLGGVGDGRDPAGPGVDRARGAVLARAGSLGMAHVWTTLASAYGHENAATARDTIAEQLNSTGIYESQELALNCIEQRFQDCAR